MESKEERNDIREYMNIKHFEQLQALFENHVNEDGSQGFDIEMVFIISKIPLTNEYMKI